MMMAKLPDVIPALSESEILALLAQGEREITAGLGYDLDEVLAEADALLSRRSA